MWYTIAMLAMRWALVLLLLLSSLTSVRSATIPPEEDVPDTHTEEEIAEAREEFESIDTNKDGFITKEEILEMDEVPEREEIDEFFGTYDTDNDGRVTFQEILKSDEELRQSAQVEGESKEL